MAKKLEKLVGENIFHLDDDRVKMLFPSRLNLYYCFNNYSASLKQINEIKGEILKDYPNMSDEEMEIVYIMNFESIRHARFTMVMVPVSTDDFIKWRNNNEIGIL